MRIVQNTRYICEICGYSYSTEAGAKECESRPVTQDKGANVGDVITITSGDGAGRKAVVTSRFVYDRAWGHYAWERYWHTVGLTADLVGSYGSRQLTFDSYTVG